MSIYMHACHPISYPSHRDSNMKNMELPKQNTKYPMLNANCIYRTWYELNLPASTSNLAYCANTECIFALCNWWSCFSFYPNIAPCPCKNQIYSYFSVSFFRKVRKVSRSWNTFLSSSQVPKCNFYSFHSAELQVCAVQDLSKLIDGFL